MIERLPTSVLFVCSQNAVRSPMAAALMRARFGKRVHVRSAGVHQGEVDGFAVTAMDEIGLDLHDHHPQSLEDLNEGLFDLVVTLSEEADTTTRRLFKADAMPVEFWPTPEPDVHADRREMRLASYRAVRDALARRIADRFGA